MSKEIDLTKCSIEQIIHCLPICLLSIFVSFSCIYISRGSVATQLTCGKIFNNCFVDNCLQNVSIK